MTKIGFKEVHGYGDRQKWLVTRKANTARLGTIIWDSGSDEYGFYPYPDQAFPAEELGEIAHFAGLQKVLNPVTSNRHRTDEDRKRSLG